MTLREARCYFTLKLAELINWAFAQGYELAIDESRVIPRRKVRKGGMKFEADDAMHMPGSLHYLGLAADLNLYVQGRYVSEGGSLEWSYIGAHWEEMGARDGLPLAWGGRFQDDNHVSFAFGGKK